MCFTYVCVKGVYMFVLCMRFIPLTLCYFNQICHSNIN